MNRRENFEEKSLIEKLDDLIKECQEFNKEIERFLKNPWGFLPQEEGKEVKE